MISTDFRPDRRLFPFESRWLELPEGKIHYVDEGEGPPILFLHGNPTWSFLYRGVIIRLRKQYRCVALDLPGFGLSDHPSNFRYTPEEHAQIVRTVVETLDLRNLTVMGHDWGGPIGMKLAIDELDRIRALVMANTWYWPTTALHLRAFSWALSTGYLRRLVYKKNFFVEKMIPLGVKHPLAGEVLQHYRGPFQTVDSRAGMAEFARQLTLSANWLGQIEIDVRRTLGQLPLLLTWGIDDLAFTPAFMDTFLRDFADASVVRLDAKHYVQEDAPGDLAKAIQEFLGT